MDNLEKATAWYDSNYDVLGRWMMRPAANAKKVGNLNLTGREVVRGEEVD